MFIVLSLFTAYLFILGYGAASFLAVPGDLFEQAALTLGVGMLVNYCLMLTGLPIAGVFAAGGLVGAFGVARLSKDLRIRAARRITRFDISLLTACGVAYVLGVYYFAILSEPLVHWDARSIWFFHAKMIWTDGALRQHGGWTHPSIAFSHPDYPKLVPAVAAQLAYVKGYWNEFLPKGSLVVLLMPLVFWMAGFRRRSLSFMLVTLVFFFSLDEWLSNGLMDGYLALYCGVALLLLGRYLVSRAAIDLYSGICALGIAASIKNEGILFAVCVIANVVFASRKDTEFRLTRVFGRIRTDAVLAPVLILSILPTPMWIVCKTAWGLKNDLTGDQSAALSRTFHRLFDGSSPQHILSVLTTRATAIWMLMALVLVISFFAVHEREKLHRGALVAIGSAALYFCGLCVAYLSTPYALDFHLSTSATRTMTIASVSLFVAMFFLLSGLELHKDPAHEGTRAERTVNATAAGC